MTALQLDVWSDIACPWCYVGKRRLEAAIADYDGEITVRWRSFELDPRAKAENSPDVNYVDRLAKKYGRSRLEAQSMIDGMTQTAAAEGLDFHFEKIRAGNTFDAHRVLHLAHEHGKQNALKERLFAAYLEEGALMSDADTLVRLAADVGLDAELVRACLASDQYAKEVRADQAQAAAIGVRGVPFFVVENRYGLSGAQPAEAFAGVFEQAAAEKVPVVTPAVTEGAMCGPEGCA